MTDDIDAVDDPEEELPSTAGEFAESHPEVWEQYADLGAACADAGPIDDDSKRLVKLGLAVAAQSEGAVHSHVRRGLEEGHDPAALEQVAILSIPTIGFPQAMAARSWITDVTDEEAE
ncbi:carboxymuconolactone decarboxylase family protein [Natronorubrum sp. JWXQ-INN-674]|uniref:Carboxymuconolactone decarboxylase family protein n=1 Tax=Natronorubrum halalkaliphilum TaxID=2691917 RepID=A0A6B0VT87_9EURY|nr:carboxymuconolactone decarboxylase family protein [Natronorubrum halalkaliphilum]MXV64574.1 carboxymuconolactone decarboxylase family protein [Natronorubrum halalkaliphilum]